MSHIKPRTATVVIYQGDDMPRLVELRRAAETARAFEEAAEDRLEEAREAEGARAGDDHTAELEALEKAEAETRARQDEYDAFVDEAAERALTIKLQSIGRRRFRDLMAEHPPRKVMVKRPDPDAEEGAPEVDVEVDHPEDAPYVVNTASFPEALLTFIDADDPKVRTIVAPKFTSAKAVQSFLDDELEDGDFPGLWASAYYLHRMPSADPKASRYSPARQSSPTK